MFERYTETARRAIFFARYEASQFGSSFIDSEHLLLGLVREGAFLKECLSADSLRSRIEQRRPLQPRVGTSVDLPLSLDGKRILAFGAEEAERLGHHAITPEHLLLGICRVENCLAAELLREQGFRREAVDDFLKSDRQNEPPPFAEEHPAIPDLPVLGPLAEPVAAQALTARRLLLGISEAESERKLKRRGWTRKQAIGHLIDLATAHHQWFARALMEPRVTAVSYPAGDWPAAQNYDLLPWRQLVYLWQQLSQLLVLVLTHTPEARWQTPCRIGIDPPVPVSELAAAYVRRVEEVLAEILTEGR